MRTLYVCDLDGTLLNDAQEVGAESAAILNGLIARGLPFTVATARSWDSAGRLLKGLRLHWPVSLMNGVFLFDPIGGKPVQQRYLAPEAGARILAGYLEAGLNPLAYTVDADGEPHVYYRGVFNESEANYISDRMGKGDKRFKLVDDYEASLAESLITLNAIDVPEKLAPLHDRFRQDPDCVCHFGPDIYAPAYHWLEIANRQATKRQAVIDLKARYGFDRIVCFGDNLNDLPMFEVADEKYAVSNAHESVKQAADAVIGSNEQNGVARFLQERFAEGFGDLDDRKAIGSDVK